MKTMDTPRTGKLGPTVFYMSPYGVCARPRVIPRNPRSAAQARMRSNLGCSSAEWSRKLTEEERQLWDTAALSVSSQPSLSQYSHLSGHQLCVKINSTLRCIGQAPVLLPPAPVVFTPNPVSGLAIVNTLETGVRLLLNVGTLTEDVMVYAQPACSAGRMKRRRVYYLGLLGPATNGQCDITALYGARFGVPSAGQKVFVVTCQTKNGWQTVESVFSAIVPPAAATAGMSKGAATPKPKSAQESSRTVERSSIAAPEDGRTPLPSQAATKKEVTPVRASEQPTPNTAAAMLVSPYPPAVYKRSTRSVQGEHSLQKLEQAVSSHCTPLVHSLLMALRRLWLIGAATVG